MPGVLAAYVVTWATLLGLVVGSFLNVVVYRVPAGVSLLRESRCGGCGVALRWYQNIPVLSWLIQRGRCAACAHPISARYPLVELGSGAFFALIAAGVMVARPTELRPVDGPQRFGTMEFWGTLAVLDVFAALSVVLALIDLDTRRLPTKIVMPGWAAMALLLTVTTIASGVDSGTAVDWTRLVTALAGGAALYAFYFTVRLISPRGMGGGDVRLAGLIGTVLGWFGAESLIVGAFAAFVLAGLFGIALILFGGAGRKTAIPFGPWMLAGAWVGIVIGQRISAWYLGL